ncbi:hypothetical protein DFH09DRAFT_1224385 [Mycena vulgaris]|nr:hypothetical protein DFH09DRAFT_1224385 [Mycena vulgaris]
MLLVRITHRRSNARHRNSTRWPSALWRIKLHNGVRKAKRLRCAPLRSRVPRPTSIPPPPADIQRFLPQILLINLVRLLVSCSIRIHHRPPPVSLASSGTHPSAPQPSPLPAHPRVRDVVHRVADGPQRTPVAWAPDNPASAASRSVARTRMHPRSRAARVLQLRAKLRLIHEGLKLRVLDAHDNRRRD